MSLHHLSIGPSSPPATVRPMPAPPVRSAPPAPAAGEFGTVLDLEAARARRAEPLPDEVLADMACASELVERLAFEGRQVRFDTHRLDGRVVAGLCDEEGALVRRLSLDDVLHGTFPEGAA